jgi:DNA-binding transcriptional LysR family regulator
MKDLDLTTIRLFVAVCESRSILRVSERENMVPSAITKRLAQLEKDAGTPLLKRVRRGVEPTAAGLSLAEKARGLLKEAQNVAEQLADARLNETQLVRIVASASSLSGRLTDDINQFLARAEHAHIRVQIEQQSSRNAVSAVRDGTISFGVVWDAMDLSGLQTQPYLPDHSVAVVHPRHPLIKRSEVSLNDCLEYDIIGLHSIRLMESLMLRTGSIKNANLRLRAEVPSFELAYRMVAAGVGICLSTRESAEIYAQLFPVAIIPLQDKWAKRRHAICFRDEESLTPAGRLLVQHLTEVSKPKLGAFSVQWNKSVVPK